MGALSRAVAPSVIFADLETAAECDAVLDALTVFIAQAERRLDAAPRRSPNQPAGWRADLEAELRIARLTLPRLQERRADIKRADERRVSAGPPTPDGAVTGDGHGT